MADDEDVPVLSRVLGTVTITTGMTEDGRYLHHVEAVDAEGDDLPLVESLGMIELAKDSLLRVPPGTEDDEDEGEMS